MKIKLSRDGTLHGDWCHRKATGSSHTGNNKKMIVRKDTRHTQEAGIYITLSVASLYLEDAMVVTRLREGYPL